MVAADELVSALVRAIATSAAEDDLDAVLAPLCETARSVAGVEAAAVVLVEEDGLRPVAASDEVARRIVALECTLGEGPTPTAIESRRVVMIDDLAAAPETWPAFAPAAMLAGMRTVAGVPVTAGDEVVGCLDLFAASGEALEESELDGARLLASVIGALVAHQRRRTEAEQLVSQLEHALAARIVVEQAKGVLAARLGVTVDEAFEVLRRGARDRNERVADVARGLLQELLDPDSVGR